MAAPRYLLIAHEAKRSGAPILLLTFARWLKGHDETPFDILLLQDGPLRSEFAAIGPTYVAPELSGRASLIGKVRHHVLKTEEAVWRAKAITRLDPARYSVVYGNSIACLPTIAALKNARNSLRAICAVHELEWVIGVLFRPGEVARLLPTLDLVVAGSEAVARNLRDRYAIAVPHIEVIHPFLEVGTAAARDSAGLRAELGLRPSDLVIVGVGTAELRKGTDLVAPIAAALAARLAGRRVRFVWLGGGDADSDLFVRMCRHDAERLGVSDVATFVPNRPGATDFIALGDVFALPSREDPFPLVALDAVRMGKPIVAFSKSGGMDELLADGAGCLVPYLDIGAFAEAIVALASNEAARESVVARARAKVAAHYDAEQLAHRLHAVFGRSDG